MHQLPSTDFLHAGIINAGGFLLNRLAPLYALSPNTLHLVLVVGLLTVIFGKCMMLIKNDIKKTLGYSTVGQMGYMIMECGLGAFSLAVFHLIAHGLFKATVFLNCGDVIHKVRLEPASPNKPPVESPGFGGLLLSVIFSLLLPLAIIVGVHYALNIQFLDVQGMFIFALFSWVTASTAMLTLFRVREKWTTTAVMLGAVTFVSVAYFFGMEAFTHFLYPEHGVVAGYLQTASLPQGAFIALAAMLILSIVGGWLALYLHYNDKFAFRAGTLWNQLYLFFINRMYMDGFAYRLFEFLKKVGRTIDSSKVIFPVLILATLALAFVEAPQLANAPMGSMPMLIITALLIPLFPLHGAYVALMTRLPRAISTILAFVLPLSALFLIPAIPAEVMPAIGVLAAGGAVWGSVKALSQQRVAHLLSYSGLALYSVLWWHLAQVGTVTSDAILFTVSLTLAIGGLFFAWQRICVRYGDLDLTKISGLFQPMPKFALCLALLVMAAAGLPPFGLFFSYLGILLNPSTTMSLSLVAIILAWFAASWYMFKLMQKLLFGPYRTDIRYKDLGSSEIALFAIVICLLVFVTGFPHLPETAFIDQAKTIGGILWTR